MGLALAVYVAMHGNAFAAGPDQPPQLSNADRAAVIASLGSQIKAKYVFPDTADQLAATLTAKAAQGDYAKADTPKAFADQLTQDLHALGRDLHFRVRYEPDFVAQPDDDTPPTQEMIDKARVDEANQAWGIATVQRLPGNVGYLDLRSFDSAELVAPAYSQAISLLSGTDALILDLRSNRGGEPAAVSYLVSHFFALGDERHLNDIYYRPKNETRAYWTNPAVSTHYSKPIYVLISPRTASGGEECAYDLQTQKRATLVGEVTWGGANPGDMLPIGHGFIAFVPSGRAINPITHTNWEHVGVKPDIAVPAADAQQRAYAEILRTFVGKETNAGRKDALTKLLARVESGAAEQMDYSRLK
ncbi:MAG: S41 family peptidase [Burkholderiales bacterium]|nr:S41 family peptidase [Burkholderiales bacterium]